MAAKRKQPPKGAPCVVCGQPTTPEDGRFGDRGTLYEGKLLCDTCYCEDEACATVYYGDDDTPNVLGEARNETGGEFLLTWHPIDPCRGYYEVYSSRYSVVNQAELLAWHESQCMLADFDKEARRLFSKHGIDHARVFARTSNVFCKNIYLFAEKKQALLASLLVSQAKEKVGYGDLRLQKNVVFDEETLSKLAKLFPEESIETDSDAISLVERRGNDLLPELVARLGAKNSSQGRRR